MPYRFKKEYRDTVISIPIWRLNLNRFNLTDEIALKIIKKMPQLAHNFEFVSEEVVAIPEAPVKPKVKEIQEVVSEEESLEDTVEAVLAEEETPATAESLEDRLDRLAEEVSKPKKPKTKPKSPGKSKGNTKKKS